MRNLIHIPAFASPTLSATKRVMEGVMISGVLYALLAGLMWGLIFVGPLLVPEYPAVLQSMGRYLALGLIVLPLAWLGRARLRQLTGKDWWTALG